MTLRSGGFGRFRKRLVAPSIEERVKEELNSGNALCFYGFVSLQKLKITSNFLNTGGRKR